MGWASGTFGLFGLKVQTVPHPILNYIGVVVAIIGCSCYAFVKPTVQDVKPEGEEDKHSTDEDEEQQYILSKHKRKNSTPLKPVSSA